VAITSLDQVIAGCQPPEHFLRTTAGLEGAGIKHSLFYNTGRPGQGSANAAGLAGAALTSVAGQIPRANPASGNAYLARLSVASSNAGTLLLADRLWHNSGIAVATTTAQTVNSVTWPARDAQGATNGEGVMVALEVSASTTNAGAITNTVISYTNSAGVAGRTASLPSAPATALLGTFLPFTLAAGDTGVRSIQSITLGTSYVSGTIHLVAYRLLSTIGVPVANVEFSVDAVTAGFPRLYNNTVPFLIWLPAVSTATTLTGQYIETHG
jgi:hypothetical protein